MKDLRLLVSLFESHYSELRNYIAFKFKSNHQDAEDIMQDAFQNMLRSQNIEHLENPKAYLYQTANNLALNRIRKQKRHNEYIKHLDESKVDELTPERVASAHKDLIRLEKALSQLPDKYRRTFLLSRVQEKSYKEISEQLNIAESTVEKHIIKTLKHLRDQLSEGVDHE